MRRMTSRTFPTGNALSEAFGPLELQVLEAIWRNPRPATVRDLQASFPRLAYTTLMTTLDRLHRKHILRRAKVGRAFVYEPQFDRNELELRLATRSIEGLLGAAEGRRAIAPLLSCFVDAVGERDQQLLDDLEELVNAKRARLDRGRSR